MRQNAIMENAYKAHHSTETAFLRVMFNIDRGNGTFLVLLDLFVAFDTIDHQIIFHILEHSIGITASFLKQSFHDLNIMVGDSNIISSNRARNLGVIFDKCMNSSVCKSTYSHLHNIGGICSILSNDACAQLIHC